MGSITQYVLGTLAFCLTLSIWRILSNLYFHPLRKFPGPKVVAATRLYEFYQQYFNDGNFMWKVKEWHEQYGKRPIIRISPDEIHITDPDYMDEIYASAPRKRNKHGFFSDSLAAPTAHATTIDHDLHRVRRSAVSTFFSTRAIVALEPLIKNKITKLLDRLYEKSGSGEIVRLDVAFSALTTDITTQYVSGTSLNHLDDPDFRKDWPRVATTFFENAPLSRHFPWIGSLMSLLPIWVVEYLLPGASVALRLEASMLADVQKVMARGKESFKHKTVYHEILDSNLPESQKSVERLVDEGKILVLAGIHTTSHNLNVIMFHLLNNPAAMFILRLELDRHFRPGHNCTFTWMDLGDLHYLSAVVYEGLRLGGGITFRSPRVCPDEVLYYKGWKIPAGTPVSNTAYYIMTNPDIFPDPSSFRPERWLETPAHGKNLRNYLLPFNKGSRACLGKTLAYAELYLTIATLVCSVELELYETTAKDVEIARDIMIGGVRKNTKGVRVRVIKRL